jgi:hypothetical protein
MFVLAAKRDFEASLDAISDQDILSYAGILDADLPLAPAPTCFDVDRFVLA